MTHPKTMSVKELRQAAREAKAREGKQAKETANTGGGLRFANITGDVKTMIADPQNAGALFQAASQFNCLEMIGPQTTPAEGVGKYGNKHCAHARTRRHGYGDMLITHSRMHSRVRARPFNA